MTVAAPKPRHGQGWPARHRHRFAEILGQSLEITRRYSLPTAADKQAAIDRLAVDEQWTSPAAEQPGFGASTLVR